jgi:Tfp pilus assembly protein PilP
MDMRLGKSIPGSAALAALAVLICGGAWAQSPTPQAQVRNAGYQAQASQQHDSPAQAPRHKSAAKSESAAPAAPASAPSEDMQITQSQNSHRDPFQSLLEATGKNGGPSNLPAGKAGLIISSIRIDGTVKADNGMIAVVSNPQDRVYFIHEGDRLYDGQVEKIKLDGVVFRQVSKDAFGKPVEREVTKRLYASAGEQQ